MKMELIVFYVAKQPYAISFSEIEEIQTAKKGTPLPFADEWHEGLITIRGSLYPLVNLRKLLGVSFDGPQESDKMILLSRARVALLVDELDNTAIIDESELRENPEVNSRDILPRAFELSDGRIVPIVNVETLLAYTRTSYV
ncbi:chemotaxis protein CheW [Paenibacillus hunanensis]|uniref:Purine-binding chemotaxis protein CheW n=1 Tax=Paenibacillus hunanensis TaxID=539262 RepID=A0ABU1IW34_9BACL|nr:chemotaxis protein CheW [Paenibacillus hunanensis]MCL9659882.1 chemotaxis protein CheW [Paenibacillus hunanensis]MDR6242423.1 purine-binding chemotaxis protein CheW [Paenibacillus hunanensis]WPP39537.1 chemotaxis protein CheW [Paenibacillus hunanensis]GGJ07708.1 chemotaxis protein CheW [Paenibacillus hunanensis]